jgi:hypothetical protein
VLWLLLLALTVPLAVGVTGVGDRQAGATSGSPADTILHPSSTYTAPAAGACLTRRTAVLRPVQFAGGLFLERLALRWLGGGRRRCGQLAHVQPGQAWARRSPQLPLDGTDRPEL